MPTTESSRRLAIERDDDPSWMSLALRMKLDLAATRISLDQWTALPASSRAALEAMPDTDAAIPAFASRLTEALATAGAGAPAALSAGKREACLLWKDPGPVPAVVAGAAGRAGIEIDWARLDRFGRFVVCHLAGRGDDARLRAAVEELVGA
jgi:hypothetical protein